MSGLWRKIAGLRADRRGTAAVEFALVAPLLLAMYFVTMELSQGIEANKKVARVGSMVADLVTQNPTTNTTELQAVMKVSESILQPYQRSKPEIIVTGIEVTPEPDSEVLIRWSRKMDAVTRPYVKDTVATIPDALMIPGTFLVRVESKLNYKPVITWSAEAKPALGLAAAFDGLDMSETYYLRPRMSPQVTCDNC
ncbi:TadE/TadG family type IV pilus assembly protein [Pseudaminobacter sp. NGMCC 1.201702]|uniref:TadE/TadG family type IV pilus assembly protein n=1 Tax=Pseudaminobacter sp. NGMCC 1.201702 TaxID=3391825 RepID=UPI0039EEAE54